MRKSLILSGNRRIGNWKIWVFETLVKSVIRSFVFCCDNKGNFFRLKILLIVFFTFIRLHRDKQCRWCFLHLIFYIPTVYIPTSEKLHFISHWNCSTSIQFVAQQRENIPLEDWSFFFFWSSTYMFCAPLFMSYGLSVCHAFNTHSHIFFSYYFPV